MRVLAVSKAPDRKGQNTVVATQICFRGFDYACIVVMSGWVPIMLIARVML